MSSSILSESNQGLNLDMDKLHKVLTALSRYTMLLSHSSLCDSLLMNQSEENQLVAFSTIFLVNSLNASLTLMLYRCSYSANWFLEWHESTASLNSHHHSRIRLNYDFEMIFCYGTSLSFSILQVSCSLLGSYFSRQSQTCLYLKVVSVSPSQDQPKDQHCLDNIDTLSHLACQVLALLETRNSFFCCWLAACSKKWLTIPLFRPKDHKHHTLFSQWLVNQEIYQQRMVIEDAFHF